MSIQQASNEVQKKYQAAEDRRSFHAGRGETFEAMKAELDRNRLFRELTKLRTLEIKARTAEDRSTPHSSAVVWERPGHAQEPRYIDVELTGEEVEAAERAKIPLEVAARQKLAAERDGNITVIIED